MSPSLPTASRAALRARAATLSFWEKIELLKSKSGKCREEPAPSALLPPRVSLALLLLLFLSRRFRELLSTSFPCDWACRSASRSPSFSSALSAFLASLLSLSFCSLRSILCARCLKRLSSWARTSSSVCFFSLAAREPAAAEDAPSRAGGGGGAAPLAPPPAPPSPRPAAMFGLSEACMAPALSDLTA